MNFDLHGKLLLSFMRGVIGEPALAYRVRAGYVFEEACRFAFATTLDRDHCEAILKMVYSQPQNRRSDEATGSVFAALLTFAVAAHIDVEKAYFDETSRLLFGGLTADDVPPPEVATLLPTPAAREPVNFVSMKSAAANKEQPKFTSMKSAAPARFAPKEKWKPISTAPQDREIIVYCPPAEGLGHLVSFCRWHPDAGFHVCEIRQPTLWQEVELPA